MKPATIPFLIGEDFPENLKKFICDIWDALVPHVALQPSFLHLGKRYSASKGIKGIEEIIKYPMVLKGFLEETRACPACGYFFHRCLGVHTGIHYVQTLGAKNVGKKPVKFFMVQEYGPWKAPHACSPVFNAAMISPLVSRHASDNIALLLAMTNQKETPTIHYIYQEKEEPFLKALQTHARKHPKVRFHELSFKEAVVHLLHRPEIFHVVCMTPLVATAFHSILSGVYEESVVYGSAYIGPKTLVFDLMPHESHLSPLSFFATLTLMMQYLSYQKTAEKIEHFLDNVSEEEIRNPTPALIQKAFFKEIVEVPCSDNQHYWRPLARRYHENNGTSMTKVGFDILLHTSIPIMELGKSLEEMTCDTTFYLQGIIDNGVVVYPSPATAVLPSHMPLCCRFLCRHKNGSFSPQELGRFMGALSGRHPWLQIAQLYHLADGANYQSFPEIF